MKFINFIIKKIFLKQKNAKMEINKKENLIKSKL